MKENDFLTLNEAKNALQEGKRVQFHWKNKETEITLKSTLSELRWNLKANLILLVSDVTNGKYSIIK